MPKQPDGETAVTDTIAGLPAFRDIAARLHELILEAAPDLQPRLWYGMPGYAKAKRSPVLCFFRVDGDDYLSLGLTEHAELAPDPASGHLLMPSAWFLTELDGPTEDQIVAIVRAAVA